MATAAATGRKAAAVAVFEVSSVRKMISAAATTTIAASPDRPSPSSRCPSHSASPVLATAAASARPPPKSSSTPQGSAAVSAQAMSRRERRSPLGTRNSASAASIASPASDSPPKPGRPSSSGRAIQAAASAAATAATRFSAALIGPSSRRITASRSRAAPPVEKPTGWRRQVSSHQQIGSSSAASGTPTSIHWAKPISTPKRSSMKAASSAFGGVPIKVAMPPIVAP